MPDPVPNAELLRSLGRLVRGLSALFWGLPAALIICVGTASAGWFKNFGMIPALAATGLLLYALWQLGYFQKQERPWRSALDRTKLLALVNFGLCPFLFWWNKMPFHPIFATAVAVLGFSALLFLFDLNLVIQRLGAMLPDETLRQETRQFTALNRGLLLAILAMVAGYLVLTRTYPGLLDRLEDLAQDPKLHRFASGVLLLLERAGPWLFLVFILLPLSMTMALIWKTKEVILDSVFNARQ